MLRAWNEIDMKRCAKCDANSLDAQEVCPKCGQRFPVGSGRPVSAHSQRSERSQAVQQASAVKTNSPNAVPVSEPRQCPICGQRFSLDQGHTVPITVGFMSAFRYLVANTPDGSSETTRRGLLRRLLQSHDYRGQMDTPTEVCTECSQAFAEGHVGSGGGITERESATAVRKSLVVAKTIHRGGPCFVCSKSIEHGVAFLLANGLIRSAERYWSALEEAATRVDARDDVCALMASIGVATPGESLVKEKMVALSQPDRKLVCDRCIRFFDIELDAARVLVSSWICGKCGAIVSSSSWTCQNCGSTSWGFIIAFFVIGSVLVAWGVSVRGLAWLAAGVGAVLWWVAAGAAWSAWKWQDISSQR